MEKSVILFDLDGTVIDSGPGIIRSLRYTLEQLEIPVDPQQDFQQFLGPPLRRNLTVLCGNNPALIEEAVQIYLRRYAQCELEQVPLYLGIDGLIRRLHSEGRTLLVATSKLRRTALRILESSGLASCFRYIAGSEPDGSLSDKAAVIRHALAEAEVANLSQALMVGDREYDVIGARTAGIDCAGVLYGYGVREEFLAAGLPEQWIVESVADLSKLLRDLSPESARQAH